MDFFLRFKSTFHTNFKQLYGTIAMETKAMCYTMEMINAMGIQINERLTQIGIAQGFENFFYIRPDSKYFRFCVPYSVLQLFYSGVIMQKKPFTIL